MLPSTPSPSLCWVGLEIFHACPAGCFSVASQLVYAMRELTPGIRGSDWNPNFVLKFKSILVREFVMPAASCWAMGNFFLALWRKNSKIGVFFLSLGMWDQSKFLTMNHSDVSISVCCSGTEQRTAYPGDPESRPRWILPLLDRRVKPGENRTHTYHLKEWVSTTGTRMFTWAQPHSTSGLISILCCGFIPSISDFHQFVFVSSLAFHLHNYFFMTQWFRPLVGMSSRKWGFLCHIWNSSIISLPKAPED